MSLYSSFSFLFSKKTGFRSVFARLYGSASLTRLDECSMKNQLEFARARLLSLSLCDSDLLLCRSAHMPSSF